MLSAIEKKERRKLYNQTYYEKHRFEILKNNSDKKDKLKCKIKLLETNISTHFSGLKNSGVNCEDKV